MRPTLEVEALEVVVVVVFLVVFVVVNCSISRAHVWADVHFASRLLMERDRIKERIRVGNKCRLLCKSQTFPFGIPESWGDPQLFQYDPATGEHICRLCSQNGKTKNADDSHVASRGHQIWVPSSSGKHCPINGPTVVVVG